MESFLERWRYWRNKYHNCCCCQDEEGGTAIDIADSKSAGAATPLLTLKQKLLRAGWIVVEWFAAWTLIVLFSTWYLWEYTHLRLSLLCSFGVEDGQQQQQCPPMVEIPATCIPHTSIQQSKDEYWKNVWTEFMDCIIKNTATAPSSAARPLGKTGDDVPSSLMGTDSPDEDEERWTQILRTNLRARQLASLILFKEPQNPNREERVPRRQELEQQQQQQQRTIRSRLRRIWPRILQFPNPVGSGDDPTYSISVIIPIYNEPFHQIQALLEHTCRTCHRPNQIQLILVYAASEEQEASNHKDNDNDNDKSCLERLIALTKTSTASSSSAAAAAARSAFVFATIKVVEYKGTRGRGGCLNFGATFARGGIWTFLHADTLLPSHWDVSIRNALQERSAPPITTMCAFSMGIDVTPFQTKNKLSYPMGLWGADHVLGYIRCSLCQLPYGDSVLSFPAHIFEYLGGYPEIPLMEDYELVQLLRKRALLLTRTFPERITILQDRIACSPRRWQRHGVAYVILSNAYCIYRYKQLQTPAEDLFEFYYHRSTSNKALDAKKES